MSDQSKPEASVLPLAVSCGEPSGIGPDIILSSWVLRAKLELPAFYVLGDIAQLSARASALGIKVPLIAVQPHQAMSSFTNALPVCALNNSATESIGKPLTSNAAAVIEAITRGVDDVVAKRASGLVTAPIAKKPLYDAGFSHPGHTEFLAALAEKHFGKPYRPVMMIVAPQLRTIPVTIHIPLMQVAHTLTTEMIVETAKIAHDDMRTKMGIMSPRLAISGLNPHAGENGSMGHEDSDIVLPAIDKLKNMGIDAVGPLPADTMFHASARARYDVALCMYHDQALIPVKTLGFDDGVNVTLGLPFIRTSPDHGTAFDIAGKGIAKPDSFIAALLLADKMAKAGHNV